MSTEQIQEIWQVDANGKIFETNFAEMTTWIDEGALLRQDKVRKGNLRWIEAGKVPALIAVFNAKDNGEPFTPPVITTTMLAPTSLPGDAAANPANFTPAPTAAEPAVSTEPVCSMHPDVPSVYICNTCANQFCKACPSSYGGTVKICPFCGAMCSSITAVEQARTEEASHAAAIGSGFGFGDFAAALYYPFKYKTSLVLGALMFMVFSLGQGAAGMGNLFLMGAAIMCFLLANMLTFGILANTVENFSQGKVGLNFMPSFDDFSLWDDVVHPFFLSIGIYITSFGPFILVFLIGLYMVMGAVKTEMNPLQSDAARTVNPQLPYAANAAKQSETVRDLLKKSQDMQAKRMQDIENEVAASRETVPVTPSAPGSHVPRTAQGALPNKAAADEEAYFEQMNQTIQDSRKAQLEGMVGKAPDTVAKEREAMISKLMGYSAVFLLAGGICLLWGFFYFPAACAVAGYTRSFVATLNPAVGIDTIRRLGLSYVKVLFMGFLILVATSFIGGVLAVIFLPFDMPGVGNLPAKAIGSLFGFYFSVVFSCVLGFALYKASDRLRLYK